MPGGRPRKFDVEMALERAMHVFWRRGYASASTTELTKAMGISPPSLYSAFGNKEGLFGQVLDRYRSGPASYLDEAVAQPTARRVAYTFLAGAVRTATDPNTPVGCLLVQGALTYTADDEPVRQELIDQRNKATASMTRRFKQAVKDGDLPPGTKPADLARYVMLLGQGIAVDAVNGTSAAAQLRAVDLALSTWPSD
jgi:AcrR family transcriptional regulator